MDEDRFAVGVVGLDFREGSSEEFLCVFEGGVVYGDAGFLGERESPVDRGGTGVGAVVCELVPRPRAVFKLGNDDAGDERADALRELVDLFGRSSAVARVIKGANRGQERASRCLRVW